MPHTSRKKRTTTATQKRLQVTDDDGWTHVTSTSNVRRVLRGTRIGNKEQGSDSQTQGQGPVQGNSEGNTNGDVELVLSPAEAPGRLTLEELQTQYQGYRERWATSETWRQLETKLGERLTGCAGTSGAGFESTRKKGPVDAIVCVGLGSPSGFLRGGWVDRRSVSMYQLAALESIAQRLSSSFPPPPLPLFTIHPNPGITSTPNIPPRNIPNPHLRPRPRLQHPRQIPPLIPKHNRNHPPSSLHPNHAANTPLLPRCRTQTSRAVTALRSVYGVWRAVGGYRV